MEIMTCNVLILYTTDTDELIKEFMTCLNKISVNTICLDDDALGSKPSHFQKLAKSRLHVIFFSPKFLHFLESKPLDAFYICNQLEPKSILAVFCNGVAEKDIRCYHTASLKDFSSWSKFYIEEQLHGGERKCSFPADLINRVKSVIYDGCSERDDVIVVPQYLTKDNNNVYVIFSKAIDKSDDIVIRLDNKRSCEIAAESINPYVLKFSLFNSFLYSPHVVSITVLKNGTIMAHQNVHFLWDVQRHSNTSPENGKKLSLRSAPSTQEEINLDEQLRFLSNFSGIISDVNDLDYASYPSISHCYLQKTKEKAKSNIDGEFSLLTFCEQHGLKESSLSIDEDTASSINSTEATIREIDSTEKEADAFEQNNLGSRFELQDVDASYQIKSFFDVDSVSRYTRRFSLPASLIPVSENHDSEDYYLDMTGKDLTDVEKKPHEKLIQNMLCYQDNLSYCDEFVGSPTSLSSGHYVSMNITAVEQRNRLSILKRHLTRSQQELLHLLHGCKMGDTTISNAENQFQQWREKHCNVVSDRKEILPVQEKTRKMLVFSFPWRSPKTKKDSKFIDKQNKVSPEIMEGLSHPSLSRIESCSSSNSSKTSVESRSSLQRIGDSTPEFMKVTETCQSPRWVSTYSPTYNKTHCPLFPEKCPPPLPTRPPPQRPTKPSPYKTPTRPHPQKPTRYAKPVPLPRKKNNLKVEEPIYVNLIKEKDACECNQEKNIGDGFENQFQSFVDLCDKYGLDELGECFISGSLFVNSLTSAKRKNSNFERHSTHLKILDVDGYESSSKGDLKRIRKKEFLRRSNSLPSSFEKSEEYLNIISDLNAIDNNKKLDETKSSNATLNDSQQELLDLMNTFKRGDKTISQVEEQFKEWHARHVGLPASLPKRRKIHKQSSFSIPGLKNLILGRPKKKTSTEKQSPEIDSPKIKRRKGSDPSISTAIQNRLSKISFTSTSSGSSDHNEVFKLQKKNNEINIDIQRKPLPPLPISVSRPGKIDDLSETDKIKKKDEFLCKQQTPRSSQKPVPPPKPKILFRQKSDAPEKPKTDSVPEIDAPPPPSSPDYIVPENRSFHKYRRKKLKDKTAGCIEPNKMTKKPSPTTTDTKHEKVPLPTRIVCHATNVSRPFLNSTSSTITDDGTELPPETLLLLKEANLISPKISDTHQNEMSLFYIRRCSSVPSISVAQLSSQPIYMELLDASQQNNMSTTKTET